MEKVDIKDISGNIRFSTPINEGSKRKFLLMKEDYVTLKFSLDSPVYFQLGDYIELTDDTTTLFELVDLQKPTYNTSTGGYDYDLRFDAYYWKWKNKKFFFTPKNAGREAGWSLTAPLKDHLSIFAKNLESLGYTYRGKAFEANIDFGVVEQTSKPLSYDNVNLIDALTIMAEAWECEWWVINDQIHFGRCEYNDPVDFEIGVNVETMERSDSQTDYATKLYAFGSTRNIPPTYRKKLVFDVKKVNGGQIADTERKLDIEYFPSNSYLRDEGIKLSYEKPYSQITNSPAKYTVLIPVSDKMAAGKYSIQADNIKSEYKDTYQIGLTVFNFQSTLSIEYVVDGVTKRQELQYELIERKGQYTPSVKFKNAVFTLEKDAINCNIRIDTSVEFVINEVNVNFNVCCYGVVRNESKAANIPVTFLTGNNQGKTFSAIYNPDLLAGDASNVIQLPEGVTASLGDMYTIDNIIKGKVSAKYFSKDDAELTISGVVQTRLMLPFDTPYVSAYRYSPTGERIDIGDERYDDPDNIEMPKEEAIEEIVIFEDEYAKYIGSTDIVPEPQEKEEEDADGHKTGKILYYYSFKDKVLKNFYENYCLENEILRISFQTGKLAGLDFSLILKESDDTGTTFEIESNEDYGRSLPDDVLFPQAEHIENGATIPADTYILYGFDTAYISEDMLPNAEKSLLDKTKEYIKKTMIDPSTYNCRMMSDRIYSSDGKHKLFEAGDRVNLISKAYFTDSRQSRIIGFEYNLDIPYDSPVYTIGETAAYSRIGEIESKIDSLTYKGQSYSGSAVGGGGTSVYVIGVNDKTVPSDRNVFSSKKSLSTFLRKDQPDTAAEIITFLKGLVSGGLIEASAGAEFGNFLSGMLGTGGAISIDPATGESYAEFDRLLIRKVATFIELVIQRSKHIGGEQVLSPASMTISKVEEYEEITLEDGTVTNNGIPKDVYRCYFETSDGNVTIFNEFEAGDQARCQTFNIQSRVTGNAENTYYWRLVTDTGDDYIDLSKIDYDNGSGVPKTGDHLTQLGNRTNPERQSAQILSSYGIDAPSWKMYNGINSYSLEGKCATWFSSKGNQISGKLVMTSGESVDDAIQHSKNYQVLVFTESGNFMLNGDINETLYAEVWHGDENITDTIAPERFSWLRISKDGVGDNVWNQLHEGVGKSIVIGNSDVVRKANFVCSVIVNNEVLTSL